MKAEICHLNQQGMSIYLRKAWNYDREFLNILRNAVWHNCLEITARDTGFESIELILKIHNTPINKV